jgi:deoxycytidylate deaminase
MRHDKILNTAFQIAKEIEKSSEQRMVAIVAYKSTIISVGMNSLKTHPMVAGAKCDDWCEHLHAETSAIINALRQTSSRKLAKCILYVCRAKIVNGVYEWGLSRPCINCQKFIKKYPIRDCYYATEVTGIYEHLKTI